MNPKKNITLIMTSAVITAARTTIKNADERLYRVNCSLVSWITSSRVDNIILCDNSAISTDIFSRLISLAKQYDKQLEVLTFSGNSSRAVTHGGGFGEGEILEHVLVNSRLIKNSAVFYKVTGGVFIENFDEICDFEHQYAVVFDMHIKPVKRIVLKCMAVIPGLLTLFSNNGLGYVRTIFYKCSVDYYSKYLRNRYHAVDWKKDIHLENSMFAPLIRYGHKPFTTRPRYVGYCAGTGKLYGMHDYPSEVKNLARELTLPVSPASAQRTK